MDISVGSVTYRLQDLDPEVDAAFASLYHVFLSPGPISAGSLDGAITPPGVSYFDRAWSQPERHDAFFNNFTPLWRVFLAGKDFDKAALVWEVALRPALLWEGKRAMPLHKGTPYYFWGMTSVLQNDLDRGYALIHQALQEDIRTLHDESPPTPAFAFATLQAKKEEQAFLDWVQIQARYLQHHLAEYHRSTGRSLSLDQLASSFLSNPRLREAVFLFGHAIARSFRLSMLDPYPLHGPFMGQLYTNILFDLALVVDALLKKLHPSSDKFIELAAVLAAASGLSLTQQKLVEINAALRSEFDSNLERLLARKWQFADGSGISDLEADIAITYGIRNFAAHNVAFSSCISSHFMEVRLSVMNALCLSVEALH